MVSRWEECSSLCFSYLSLTRAFHHAEYDTNILRDPVVGFSHEVPINTTKLHLRSTKETAIQAHAEEVTIVLFI